MSVHRIAVCGYPNADRLCLSAKHLARVVKGMLGRTPHDVICSELLHHAMAMLEDENIPIADVAEALCFSDQASFSKFFKKHTGVSPMQYRRCIFSRDEVL